MGTPKHHPHHHHPPRVTVSFIIWKVGRNLSVGCPRLDGEIYVEIYFPDVPPRNVGFGDFLGKVRVLLAKRHMVMPIFINEMCSDHVWNFRSS